MFRLATRLFVDHIVYVTRDLQASLKGNGCNSETSVIYNGIPAISTGSCTVPSDLNQDKFNIGIVGRISEVKGHRFLLSALERLLDLPDLRLNILGEGPLKSELESYCESNGLAGIVTFLGFKENVYDYMNAFDVLAMPSLYEGLPYVLLESMYLRTPIIASDVGGLREILCDKDDSLLVEPGDAKGLAEAIRYLHNHKAERACLAENAYKKVCRHFMIDKMVEKYADIFLKHANIRSEKDISPAITSTHKALSSQTGTSKNDNGFPS